MFYYNCHQDSNNLHKLLKQWRQYLYKGGPKLYHFCSSCTLSPRKPKTWN